jgi:hypothetical protein
MVFIQVILSPPAHLRDVAAYGLSAIDTQSGSMVLGRLLRRVLSGFYGEDS